MFNLWYLFDPRPDPLSQEYIYLHLALMAFFGFGLLAGLTGYARRIWSDEVRLLLRAQAPLSCTGLILVGARILGIPYLSARVLLLAMLLLSLVAWVCGGLIVARRRGYLESQLAILTFFQFEKNLSRTVTLGLLLPHFLGLALLATQFRVPYAWALMLLLLLASPMITYSLAARRLVFRIEALTPLFYLYAVLALRRLLENLIVPSALANLYPLVVATSPEVALLASVTYALLCQLWVITENRDKFLRVAAAILVTLTFLWAGAEYLGHSTRGVTGSDPYAYTQMAVDLVREGRPWHRFTLFSTATGLEIAKWPLVHVGYRLPFDARGDAATVWPIGGSVLLALGYLLVGEHGLYITMPIIGLICLVVVWALTNEVLSEELLGERRFGAAVAVFILATSYEQVDRLRVPLVDVAAQLFTVLTVLLALKAVRGKQGLYGFSAGLAFGSAYFMRHTQLVMVVPVLLILLLLGQTLRRGDRLRFLLAFGLATALVTFPDLLYHKVAMGGFLVPESEELALFSLTSMMSTLPLMLRDVFSGNEFGYLLPLILWGTYVLYRQRGAMLWVLISWVGAVLLVHLPYAALRLRDLLSFFPAIAVLGAYGFSDLWRRFTGGERWCLGGRAVAAALILVLFLLPAYRGRLTLAAPLNSQPMTFGAMTEAQRAAFGHLGELTAPGSVIGSHLNSGPIDLYGERESFRPEYWTDEEFATFVSAMWADGRDVYLLDDQCEPGWAISLAREYELEPVAQLDLPLPICPRLGDMRNLYRLIPREVR